jgi:hypothetical protein
MGVTTYQISLGGELQIRLALWRKKDKSDPAKETDDAFLKRKVVEMMNKELGTV